MGCLEADGCSHPLVRLSASLFQLVTVPLCDCSSLLAYVVMIFQTVPLDILSN